ncbi:MAG TPA: multicopper oxidase domain-containing protein, partial [Longimicrobiales bacterium]|nr:multicopper oxidase domain-containing protein [Longimicrobiales bacterium]
MRGYALGSVCCAGLCAAVALMATTWPAAPRAIGEIQVNDNTKPAGELRAGVLTLNLVAGEGTWFPEANEAPGRTVYAFGESAGSLRNPGPLVRVPAGTEIRVTLRNTLDSTLIVHGLHDRPAPDQPIDVPAGGTQSVRFRVIEPGTYLYWGTTQKAPLIRDRWGKETQLNGAIVVDPPGVTPDDHVFVVSLEDGPGPIIPDRPIFAAVVNGRSWPHSHQSIVTVGDTVRMRWINASDRGHPLHLHGFYFRIDARGDGARDTIYNGAQQRLAVTELVAPGQSMALQWIPERPGNWLMHCHMAVHMSHELRRGPHQVSADHSQNHTMQVMAGLVTGWRVEPRAGAQKASAAGTEARRIRLVAQMQPGKYGADPGLGFAIDPELVDGDAGSTKIPGPPLVLERGQPVQITVVNRLNAPTSIHWHGIELESYFDGVSGWSGYSGQLAPAVQPRDSFVVRFTPPRAGTFIYHSHFDEERQLSSGMYGPLIVVEPGQKFDPAHDRIWVLSQNGPAKGVRPMLNGETSPVVELNAQQRYRIRLININPNMPLTLFVLADSLPARWRAVAKDGADLPPHQAG